jgi:hypothetical protein
MLRIFVEVSVLMDLLQEAFEEGLLLFKVDRQMQVFGKQMDYYCLSHHWNYLGHFQQVWAYFRIRH